MSRKRSRSGRDDCTHVPLISDLTQLRAALQDAASLGAPPSRESLHTVMYMWERHRCGIWCCVRRGRLRAVGFVNRQYTNTWGETCVFVAADGRTEMDWESFHNDYLKETGNALPADMLPAARWWTNGATLCESEAPGGWSLGAFAKVFPLLAEACQGLPDTEFIFNRRDGPVLRDGSDNDHKNIKLPVIGFYEKKTPPAAADGGEDSLRRRQYAVPNYEDWASRDSLACAAYDKPVVFRTQRAFFRGSTTGPGTCVRDNVRLRLCHLGRCRENTIMDVAPTRFNRRLRVFRTKDGGGGRSLVAVTFQRPSSFGHIHPAPAVSLPAWCGWAITIYARGHAGATRFLHQLALGGVLIDFDPEESIPVHKHVALPEVWASSALASSALPHAELLAIAKARTTTAEAEKRQRLVKGLRWTHVRVTEADQLLDVIEALLECPQLAQQLASNGRAAALHMTEKIVEHTRVVVARACGLLL